MNTTIMTAAESDGFDGALPQKSLAIQAIANRAIRLRRVVAKVAGSALVGAVLVSTCRADPQSDLFQPDVFRTGNALRKGTVGLNDPRGANCPAPSGTLSLQGAVDVALCRSPTTRSAWAAARQQAAAYGGAESAWLPTVTGPVSVTRTYGDHVDVAGQSVLNDQTTKDAALNLSWLVYDFGGRGSKIDSARYLLNSQAATVNRVAQQIVQSVIQTFYGVVAADAAVVASTTARDIYAKSVNIATALQKGGVASLADVLQAETALDQAALALVQAQYTARAAHGALSVAIGSSADEAFKVDAKPVPTEVPTLTQRMEDLMAEARRQRPDLAAAIAQRDAAIANVTVARAVGRPSISIQGGRTFSDQTGVPNQNYNQVGIYVTVPIFSGFAVDYGVRQAQAALEGSEANVDQVRLTVTSDVWNSYYSLVSANEQLGATATLVKTANQNQEVELGRYQAGVATILDVLTAEAAASSAAQSRISAELAWETSRGQLALALGHLSRAEPLVADPDLP